MAKLRVVECRKLFRAVPEKPAERLFPDGRVGRQDLEQRAPRS